MCVTFDQVYYIISKHPHYVFYVLQEALTKVSLLLTCLDQPSVYTLYDLPDQSF